MTRPIFFLSDFGTFDTYVGVVKAVILGIAPGTQIVDLTHAIPPQDVRGGAFALLTAAPYLPADAVVLAVVDPGVGTDRRAIAIQVAGRTFVGPDNGLLSRAVSSLVPASDDPGPHAGAESRSQSPRSVLARAANAAPSRWESAGVRAVVLDRADTWMPTVSATFHGRDIFGPVAAHLARGAHMEDVGSPTEALVRLPLPSPEITRDGAGSIVRAEGTVVHVDHFGNLISSLRAADLPAQPCVSIGDQTIVGLSPHFQPDSQQKLIALIGSAGLLEISVPNGSAANSLNQGVGATVTVTAEHAPKPADTITRPDAWPRPY